MTGFDFFAQEALPAPSVSAERAVQLVRDRYGIDGTATELGSQQDANFRVDTTAGRYVLKVSNPAFTAADLRAQDLAAAHLARCEPDIRVPAAVPGLDGATVQPVEVDGLSTAVRLVIYVDGQVLSAGGYLAPSIVEALGDLAGRTSRALATFDGEVPARALQWDVRHAEAVVTRLAEFADDADRVRAAAAAAATALEPFRSGLPVQIIHGDVTDDNVVAVVDRAGRHRPTGLIDFGDMTTSWAIAELAVTCTALLPHAGADLSAILPAVVAFDRVRPVSDAELGALWPLVVLRAAAQMVSGRHQARIDGGNRYACGNLDRERRTFEQSVSVPIDVMTSLVRAALRPAARPPVVRGRTLLSAPAEPVLLELATTGSRLHGGAFLRGEAALAAEALAASGSVAAYVPYLQPRLTRTVLNSPVAPATVGLGVEVFTDAPMTVRAPWAGVVEVDDDAVGLRAADGTTLWLTGPLVDVDGGTTLVAGDPIGRVSGAPGAGPWAVRVQVSLGPGRPPFLVPAALAGAWAHRCPDPTPLLAIDTSDGPDANDLLDRRGAAFAPVQEHYFHAPPQIERGWRQHLFDVDGRSYLDMVNNVAILGHGHPGLADAVDGQWRRLNTNSRFHYRAVVEFSERLAALLPDPLDTVFLVNSGTEAVDLALRLAWASTGRRDVVAVREAYHGWSDATDAVSTSVADNPDAPESRPAWVHTVDAPNPFRGRYRGDDAHRYATEAVAVVDDLVRAGRPPAAFLCEPYYGNAGGMALPDGYLAQVYASVRRAGGLCVADEVQVGYGRLGEYFWGFQQQDVVPDVVTIAKAMGNGHPLGAVVTTRAVADAFRSQGYFFSSAGGSPVSSAVGLAVLDALHDERLRENARTVGAHLRDRLLELAGRHPIVGAVHGTGLYLGVELVRDHDTLEPAVEETAAICERLRELGVIMQPTSDRMCVLKIKPPLCITTTDADYFADMLDRTLTDGW